MTATEIESVAQRELRQVRRRLLFPPIREAEVKPIPGDPNLVGTLVGRRVILNQEFITRMAATHRVSPETIIRAGLARALNRYLRVPGDFYTVLKLYAAIRQENADADTAMRHLEVYLALWNEIDLYENRGFGKELLALYRASLADPSRVDKLGTVYKILVGILQMRWGVFLGLEKLDGWEHLAKELAKIDYLNSSNREEDAKKFSHLFKRCCQIVEKTIKEEDNKSPYWALENTIDTFTALQETREGLAAFLEELGEEGLVYLEELAKYFKKAVSVLGNAMLLEANRWWFYQHLAEKYGIEVFKTPVNPEGQPFNVSITTWNPEDGLQLIYIPPLGRIGTPGLTKRWLRSGPESQLVRKEVPDLVVIIDSSGSMPDAVSTTSYPVLAAFVVARTYLIQGSQVAVVNFSSNVLVQEFTTDEVAVYKHLAAFQAGGTTFPTQVLEDVLKKARRPVDIVLISDMDIANAQEAWEWLINHSVLHRLFIFLNGGHEKVKEIKKKLRGKPVEIHPVDNDLSLVDLVLGRVRASFTMGR